MKQTVILMYIITFYSVILIGCIRKKRRTKMIRSEAAQMDRRRRERFEETCKPLSHSYSDEKLTTNKEQKNTKKMESIHTARMALECSKKKDSGRDRPSSARPARLGYNKSLIAIQEQALSKIFNETNSEQSRASARQTDRKMMKRDKSLELGRTQHSLDN